jgi:HEPN domain-containing protein
MSDRHEEWLRQADYDMDTADAMFNSGRYFYAVFMCHLSIEKSLKGLYSKIIGDVPPKTHNLIYLLIKIGKGPDQELERFITKLNTAGVATRYPDDLEKIQAAYTDKITRELIEKSKDVLQWVKTQLLAS